jgi:hypothetical protein
MRKIFRTVLLIVGGLATLLGLIWIGQGTGVFPYPAQSFMINQMPWVWRGVAVMLAGLIAVFVSRRV